MESSSPQSATTAAVDKWFHHVDHLARVIGPRGSTTLDEARAAEYARETFQQVGLEPRVETFQSAKSAWRPFAWMTGLALVSFLLFPVAGRITAGIALFVTAVALVSALLEIHVLGNPLRFLLAKGTSRNVWASVSPSGEARCRAVVLGHIDSHRTPLLFRSHNWQRVMQIVVPAGFVAIAALAVIFAVGLAVQTRTLYFVSIVPAAVVAPLFLLVLQPDLTPYTAGANDNATGAALPLALAEILQAQPLEQTEVWLVASGCEEVGLYGATAFFRQHRAELQDAIVLVVDTVGGQGSGPCYFRSEGMVIQFKYDAGLLALADTIAAERPELGAYSRKMTEAQTEGLPAIHAGLRALTLCGFTPDGELPNWHQPSDVVENVDREVLGRNYEFVMEFLRRIEAGAALEDAS